jgi:glucosamine-6-phosphate deaminase
MEVIICKDKNELGRRAAHDGAEAIRAAIARKGEANIIVGTGGSQVEMIEALVKEPVDWTKVSVFHLDEYVGLPVSHSASFRRFLRERIIAKLPAKVKEVHEVNGEGDVQAECRRLMGIIGPREMDVAFLGIGENGHIAFNDPPADFNTNDPYIVVTLDVPCRMQQVGEGWYPNLEAVPKQAISMSVRQVMKAKHLVFSVPG